MKIYRYDFLLDKILKSNKEVLKSLLDKISNTYEIIAIPKKNGYRTIYMLKDTPQGKKLTSFQKNLARRFFQKIPIAVPAKGFVKGESYQSFLIPHIGNSFFLRIDIKDFFDSFSEELMMKNLKEFIKDEEALDTVFELCTVQGGLPQGAVTSPILSNIFFRRIDQRILKYCQSIDERYREEWGRPEKRGIRRICYTRYADDMLFSSNFFNFKENIYFLRMISKILKENGFEINRKKTIMSQDEITLNGYVIDDSLRLSRRKLQGVREVLYFFKEKDLDKYIVDQRKIQEIDNSIKELNHIRRDKGVGQPEFGNKQSLIYYLAGCRSWIISVVQTQKLSKQDYSKMKKLIERIQLLLDALEGAKD